MFQSARLKLTAWYLLIIMTVSLTFSGIIYFSSSREFDRILRVQRLHVLQYNGLPGGTVDILRPPDPQITAQARERTITSLINANILVLIFSAIAGYFLAGRTLRPIQKMVEEQNRFIADASHELNTPLTALRTTIEVNLRDDSLTLAGAKKALSSNLEDVESLQSLSSDLMQLSHYQQTSYAYDSFTPLSLLDILEKSKERVAPMIEKKHMRLSIKIPAVTVLGNERSLTELFVILLDNAVKYSEEEKQIKVSGKKTDGKISLAIVDQGIGMSKEDLSHIFDRFYRADTSRTKQRIPGYGLGLSIAKRIVTLHRGTLTVTSVLSKGSVFTVTLPVKA